MSLLVEGLSIVFGIVGGTGGAGVLVSHHKRRQLPHHLNSEHLRHVNEMEADLGFPLSNYTDYGVDSYAIAAETAARVARENERAINAAEEVLDPEAALKRRVAVVQATPESMLGGTDHKSVEEIEAEFVKSLSFGQPVQLTDALRALCHTIAENVHHASNPRMIQPMDEPYPIEIVPPSTSSECPGTWNRDAALTEARIRDVKDRVREVEEQVRAGAARDVRHAMIMMSYIIVMIGAVAGLFLGHA
jgi:hypothetical protein